MKRPMVSYEIAYESLTGPVPANLYSYELAANGVFVRAERRGVAVRVPISPVMIRGLATLEPSVDLSVPRIPREFVVTMLEHAQAARDSQGRPIEILFHLYVEEGRWHLIVPPQQQSPVSVSLVPDAPQTYPAGSVLVEVHSHHSMASYFSPTDDDDEQGFRLYAVLGTIFTQPTLRLRVGVYGYFFAIPTDILFEMPSGMVDGLVADQVFADDTDEVILQPSAPSALPRIAATWLHSGWAQRLAHLFIPRTGEK